MKTILVRMLALFAGLLPMACTAEEDRADGASENHGVCEVFCRQLRCDAEDDSSAECVQGCRDELWGSDRERSACGDAVAELFVCVGRLDCDELDDYYEEPTSDYPCAVEDDEVRWACDGA